MHLYSHLLRYCAPPQESGLWRLAAVLTARALPLSSHGASPDRAAALSRWAEAVWAGEGCAWRAAGLLASAGCLRAAARLLLEAGLPDAAAAFTASAVHAGLAVAAARLKPGNPPSSNGGQENVTASGSATVGLAGSGSAELGDPWSARHEPPTLDALGGRSGSLSPHAAAVELYDVLEGPGGAGLAPRGPAVAAAAGSPGPGSGGALHAPLTCVQACELAFERYVHDLLGQL